MMNLTRAQFKFAMRFCKNNEDQLTYDALATEYLYIFGEKRIKNENNAKATTFNSVVGNATDHNRSIALL